jgi:hypothetical protein
MDRKSKIEVTSFEHYIIEIDGVKHIRYVMKSIVDGEDIQCNLQEVYKGYPITKEGLLERAREGMIKERYR